MPHFWVHFKDRKPGCVGCAASEAEARELAETFGSVKEMWTLPYPASPRLDDKDGWDHENGEIPSFCHKPEQCKGHGCCRQNPSCTE